jgi:hypothetical protein
MQSVPTTAQAIAPAAVAAPSPVTASPSNKKIIDFIVLSYTQLMQDLKNGNGPYIDSLLAMLNIQTDRPETIKKIKHLSEVYTVIPEFAERVTDLNRTPTSFTPVPTPMPVPTASIKMTTYTGDEIAFQAERLPKNTPMKVTLKSGGQSYDGLLDQLLDDKLWLHSPTRSFPLQKIEKIEVPESR